MAVHERRRDSHGRFAQAPAIELIKGRSVIVHTAIGSQDERVARVRAGAEAMRINPETSNELIDDSLGRIAEEIFRELGVRRLIVTGGDTAGRVQRRLGVEALEIAASLPDRAPLSYVYSRIPQVNGMEMALKGGQVGKEGYFQTMQSLDTIPFAD